MKLLSKLPKIEGLSMLSDAMTNQPSIPRVLLLVVDTQKLTTNLDDGSIEPTARILKIEPVARVDIPEAEKLLRRAVESRTGQATLPLDLEDEITVLFEGMRVDTTTGEIIDGEVGQ